MSDDETEGRKEPSYKQIIQRAKWTFDGAESIEEMAQMLEAKAEHLRELDEEGWELEQPVTDDYAYLKSPEEE